MSSYNNRVIVLIDMDCFYCQVEEKLDPTLIGKPIAVVQYNAWRGGGIIAVNYEARAKGVTRHMRGNEAKDKCPEIKLVKVPNVRGKADLTKYREAGKRVAEVLQTFTPLLQRASVDEAYLDITEAVSKRISDKLTIDQLPNTYVVGCETKDFAHNIYSEFNNDSNLKLAIGAAIVEEIRAKVYEKTGYRCSAGIAHNKILAKLACGINKPNKQTILPQDGVEDLYKNLPLKKIKSLGGKFGASLSEDLNITYMGELVKFSERDLQKKYDEKTGHWLYNIARGIDKEPVQIRLVSKSIGCCKKFSGRSALVKPEEVMHWLSELALEISERLQQDTEENNRRAKQITVSFAQPFNRTDVHKSRVLALNSYEAKRIANDAFEILKKVAQKPDQTFQLTFLGLNVGKFEDCKNNGDISNFFKRTVKTETNLSKNDITTDELKTYNSEDENLENILKFLQKNKSDETISNVENDLKPSTANKDKDQELDLNEIEEDAQHSDTDFNKTVQELQNFNSINESTFSDSTVEEDYSEEINRREEFPNFSEHSDTGDTSKSFFMKYVKKFDIENKATVSETQSEIITISENSNDSSVITDETDNFCPECNKIIPIYDFITHMDHHMAEKLMQEEKQIFQQELQARKQNLVSKSTKEKIVKTKSVKRKLTVENNCSIASFLRNVNEVNKENEESKQCPECEKRVSVSDYNCHMDFHAAKKLHLELNPPPTQVVEGKKSVNVVNNNNNNNNNNNKKKNCKTVNNGMMNISQFFKAVNN